MFVFIIIFFFLGLFCLGVGNTEERQTAVDMDKMHLTDTITRIIITVFSNTVTSVLCRVYLPLVVVDFIHESKYY